MIGALTHVGWHADRCDELVTRRKRSERWLSVEPRHPPTAPIMAVVLTRAHHTPGGSDAQTNEIH